jgi:uncharacterized protein (TIGR02145 family)
MRFINYSINKKMYEMKKQLLFWILLTAMNFLPVGSNGVMAQNVAINDTGLEPHPSAVLDLQAADKGLLIPRLEADARVAIADPAVGLMVYQTDGREGFYYYDGMGWQLIDGGGAGSGSVTDADGNSYATVFIGEQLWMTGNLAVTHFRNGDLIPFAVSAEQWSTADGPLHTAYNGLPDSYVPDFGLLYNAFAVSDGRELCPEGWRVPSAADWHTLASHLGEGAGGKLKALYGWEPPNTDAGNGSGFSALPGGYREASGTFTAFRRQGAFWTSDAAAGSTSAAVVLQHDAGEVFFEPRDNNEGLAVRCVRGGGGSPRSK